MIVRLTFCKFQPDRIVEAKKIYNEEVIPTIKKQKGNTGVRLLEPTDKADDYISITEWKTKADADAYHTSGVYKSLVNKLQGFFTKQPELKAYSVEEVMEPSPHLL
jgi:heme-degrading monooxygenase HmoA